MADLSIADMVDWSHPLSDDPLNRGLVAGYLAVPNAMGWGSLTWRDLCGQNHGTLTNGPTWTGDSHRGGFGAMRFDGVNDYILCDNTSLNSAAAFSISVYVKANDFSATSGVNTVWTKGGLVAFGSDILLFLSGTGVISVQVNNGADGTATGPTLVANTWYHILCIFDGGQSDNASRLKIFLNGVSQSLSYDAYTVPSTTANMGSNPFALAYYWPSIATSTCLKGSIDAVRIYNRALSAPEVADLYHRESNYFDGLLNRYDDVWATMGGFNPAWALHRNQLIGGGVL